MATNYHAYKKLYAKVSKLARIYQMSSDPGYKQRIKAVCSDATTVDSEGRDVYGYLYTLSGNGVGSFNLGVADTININTSELPTFGSQWGYYEYLKVCSLFQIFGFTPPDNFQYPHFYD
jgi:hypothetical protein